MSKSRRQTKRRNSPAPLIASNGHARAQIVVEEASATQPGQGDVVPFVAPKYLPMARGLMLVLLLLGLAWRFVGLKWDAGHHLHPDERFLTMVVPELKLPASLADWFRTNSSGFNPYVSRPETGLFVYGQLPLLIAKLVATRLSSESFNWDSYDGILILGRALSALVDAGTVLVTWLIGRRLLGRDGGLLAAILLAFTALHIQLAHFYTVDTFATFFLVLAFWALLKWLDDRRVRWAFAAGAAWGLSAACKISTLLFAPIIALAVVGPVVSIYAARRVVRRGQLPSPEQLAYDDTARPQMPVLDLFCGALALLVAAIVFFRLGHPMAFRGEAGPLSGFFDLRLATGPTITGVDKTFWTSFAEQRDITIGQGDVPWNLQWFGRLNLLWPLRNLLLWGVGWQAMVPALAALVWLPLRVWKRAENPQWLLVVAWALLGFGYNAMQYSKFSRYFLVVTPFFALLAAWCAARIWQLAHEHYAKYLRSLQHEAQREILEGGSEKQNEKQNEKQRVDRRKYLPLGAALTVGAILGGSVCWGSAVASIYSVPNTRVAASEFLHSLPPRTRLANESSWDDALPLDGQEKFEMLNLKLVDHEEAPWRQNLLDSLDRSDWLVTSSPRMWASLPRLPMRYPTSTRLYQALFSGRLGLVPEREFTAYPQLNLLGWRLDFPDDNTEEGLTVYDHPRVVLWQRGAAWSRSNAESILDPGLLDQVDNAPLSELIERGAQVDESALPWLPSPAPLAGWQGEKGAR